MLKESIAFSSFSVNDIQRARDFYGRTLGLEFSEMPEGLELRIAGGTCRYSYIPSLTIFPQHSRSLIFR